MGEIHVGARRWRFWGARGGFCVPKPVSPHPPYPLLHLWEKGESGHPNARSGRCKRLRHSSLIARHWLRPSNGVSLTTRTIGPLA